MAETQQQAEARIRVESPEGSVSVVLGRDEDRNPIIQTLAGAVYDAWVADRATIQIQQQLLDEIEAPKRTLREQVRNRRSRLQTIASAVVPVANNTIRDNATKDVADTLDKLIGVLIDRGILTLEG